MCKDIETGKTGQYYILPVCGCTDPEPLVGPFGDFDSMLAEARKIRASQSEEDALFWLTMDGSAPSVNSFVSGEINPDMDDDTV